MNFREKNRARGGVENMNFDPAMKPLIGTPAFCTYTDFKLLMMGNSATTRLKCVLSGQPGAGALYSLQDLEGFWAFSQGLLESIIITHIPELQQEKEFS